MATVNNTSSSNFTYSSAISAASATTYTVTYNANGGSVSPPSASTNAGGSVTLPTPTRSGYTFNGWYTASSGGTRVGGAGSSYTLSGNVTLYAQWTQNNPTSYTLTLIPNGGSVSPTSTQGRPGETYNLPSPTRSGYTFKEWTLNGYGSLNGNTYIFGTGNGAVVANWTSDSGIPVKVGTVTQGDWRFDLYEDGTATIVEYSGSATNLTVPDKFDYITVTGIGDYAFANCTTLRSITIPNSIKTIGDGAFIRCSALASVSLPQNLAAIKYSTFTDCSSLESIMIPNTVMYIGEQAFAGCTSLTAIAIPNSVSYIVQNAFYGAGLRSVSIPASVVDIGRNAFAFCRSLTAITVDTANPTYKSIGGVLFNASADTLLMYPAGGSTAYTIPDSVKNIYHDAFFGCANLSSVTIPDNVTSIGQYAFRNCVSLTSITIPASVTNIWSGAFSNCSSSFTIQGMLGSHAQTYANENEIPFVSLSHTLTYDANGGSDTPSVQVNPVAVSTALPKNVSPFTGEPYPYTFLGWADSSSATVATYLPGAPITLTGNKTIYAVWKYAETLALNVTTPVTIAYPGQVVRFQYQPAVGGMYAFTSTGSLDTVGSVSGILGPAGVDYDDDNGEGYNFYFEKQLYSGQTGTFSVYIHPTAMIQTGTFNVRLTLKQLSHFVTYNVTENGGQLDFPLTHPAVVEGYPIGLSLNADAVQSSKPGWTFVGWNTDKNATTGLTYLPMGTQDVTLYAIYKDNTSVVNYALTVVNGSGSGSFAAGTLVTVIADVAPAGKVFDQWITTGITFAPTTGSTNQFTMPANAVTVTATYKNTPVATYRLTVVDGSGGGDFSAGTTVTITANTAPAGQRFKQWNINPSVTFTGGTSATSATAKFTMPPQAVTATAIYETIPPGTYTVTVNSGSGGGSYATNATVTITANAAPSGKVFDKWTTSDGVNFANASATTTTFTMPAKNVSVTATYKDAAKKIFSTKYDATFLNWILFFIGFGFIWMWF